MRVRFHPASIVAPLALCAAASGIAAPAGPDAPGFSAIVQPFLAQNCYLCHDAKLKTGGLNLEAYAAADSVLRDRDKWELVLKKLQTGEMPPKGIPRPKEDDLQAVTRWIAGEFERADRLTTPEAGRVTARRLNRAEYNNTLRDLLGLDLHLADAFPQDDAGYGFDNIGDVLSLSPILMEKYLAAAGKATRAALFGPEPRKPTLVRLPSQRRKIVPVTVPPLDYDRSGLSLPNALHLTHRFPVDGDYTFRILARGLRVLGSEPIHISLWIDGRESGQAELDAPVGETPGLADFFTHSVELRTRITAGDHWIAASITRLYEGLPPRFGGPNPSTKPIPPEPDLAAAFKPRPGASEKRIKQLEKDLEAARKLLQQANGVAIDRIELAGPYNQPAGPSEASLRKVYVCGHLRGQHQPACARKIVASFAYRAFRRPVTAREVDQYAALVSTTQRQGDSFEEGVGLALQAILVSPDFLFRIERNSPAAGGSAVHPVSQFELASRLSYFLWSSTPDDELLDCAARGTLRDPSVLAGQVSRMLKDPKSAALADNFAGQWLETRALESIQPDHDRFPDFDEYLRMSMRRETEMFFDSLIRGDGSILDFIDGKYTFLNQRLAEFYNLPGVKGPEFRRVDLSDYPERGGVITQASVLTVSSYATRTSPVLRGKWILANILDDPPPPPPPGVPNLDVTGIGASVSLRQQLEKHRTNPVCASCHQRMDPLGFGLENYNAIGAWRGEDGNLPIDASGSLPGGRSFEGSQGLKAILMEDRDVFARCLAGKLLTYALGRGLERYDKLTVNAIVRQAAAGGYRFSSLILAIVNSVPFQMQDEKGGPDQHANHHS